MIINIDNEYSGQLKILKEFDIIIQDVVESTCDFMKCPYETEVNVLFTDDETIHQINLENRGIDRPTDVVSFPMIDFEAPADLSGVEDMQYEYFNSDTGCLMLGDIVISIDRAYSQAEEYGHSVKREIAFLTAHSMLHLMGYDHMVDEERLVMEQRQEEILAICGYSR